MGNWSEADLQKSGGIETVDVNVCPGCKRSVEIVTAIGHHPDCQNTRPLPYTDPQATAKRSGRVQHQAGKMNRTEAEYGLLLEALLRAGDIEWYGFEAFNLKLADKTYFKPDFVVKRNGLTEFHEVKAKRRGSAVGHFEDDARVKIKVAAAKFPYKFVAVIRGDRDWETEEWNG